MVEGRLRDCLPEKAVEILRGRRDRLLGHGEEDGCGRDESDVGRNDERVPDRVDGQKRLERGDDAPARYVVAVLIEVRLVRGLDCCALIKSHEEFLGKGNEGQRRATPLRAIDESDAESGEELGENGGLDAVVDGETLVLVVLEIEAAPVDVRLGARKGRDVDRGGRLHEFDDRFDGHPRLAKLIAAVH